MVCLCSLVCVCVCVCVCAFVCVREWLGVVRAVASKDAELVELRAAALARESAAPVLAAADACVGPSSPSWGGGPGEGTGEELARTRAACGRVFDELSRARRNAAAAIGRAGGVRACTLRVRAARGGASDGGACGRRLPTCGAASLWYRQSASAGRGVPPNCGPSPPRSSLRCRLRRRTVAPPPSWRALPWTRRWRPRGPARTRAACWPAWPRPWPGRAHAGARRGPRPSLWRGAHAAGAAWTGTRRAACRGGVVRAAARGSGWGSLAR